MKKFIFNLENHAKVATLNTEMVNVQVLNNSNGSIAPI
jgi:hypothetical protein